MCSIYYSICNKHCFMKISINQGSYFYCFYSFSGSFVISSSLRMAAWDLSVTVEDLGPEAPPIKISVTSDLHIGGVILKIVEKIRELCPISYIMHGWKGTIVLYKMLCMQ